jgi:hypothetical protein
MRDVEGLSWRDIAAKLNLDVGTLLRAYAAGERTPLPCGARVI